MNKLNLYVAEGDQAQRGFRRTLSSPTHPRPIANYASHPVMDWGSMS